MTGRFLSLVSKRQRFIAWMKPLWTPLVVLAVLSVVMAFVTPHEDFHYLAAAVIVTVTMLVGLRTSQDDFWDSFGVVQDSFDEVRRSHRGKIMELERAAEEARTGHQQNRDLILKLDGRITRLVSALKNIAPLAKHLPPEEKK